MALLFAGEDVQATGNYVAVAAPVARGGKIDVGQRHAKTWQAGSVTAPRTVLDIRQIQDAVSLRDLAPGRSRCSLR